MNICIYLPALCKYDWMQVLCTALGKATRLGHTDTVTLLLMRNAQPDLKDKVRGKNCMCPNTLCKKSGLSCFGGYRGSRTPDDFEM